MSIKKTTLSLLLTMAFLFGSLPPFSFIFQPIKVSASVADYYNVTVYAGDPIPTSMINYNGGTIYPSAYIIADGVEYPAFCVDPNLYGAEWHPNEQYPLNVAGTNHCPLVSTVLHNSVPYVTKESILALFPGLSDLANLCGV